MLVRRFTIVCLLITLFGIGFAGLVAEAGRSTRLWAPGKVVPCFFEDGPRCVHPVRN